MEGVEGLRQKQDHRPHSTRWNFPNDAVAQQLDQWRGTTSVPALLDKLTRVRLFSTSGGLLLAFLLTVISYFIMFCHLCFDLFI